MTDRVDGETMDAALAHVKLMDHVVVDTMPSTITDLEGCVFQIVAWDERRDEMAFIRVVQCSHENPDPVALVRTFRPTAERMRKASREAGKWCRDKRVDWKGSRRFDRIEVYGTERRVFDWTKNVKGKL